METASASTGSAVLHVRREGVCLRGSPWVKVMFGRTQFPLAVLTVVVLRRDTLVRGSCGIYHDPFASLSYFFQDAPHIRFFLPLDCWKWFSLVIMGLWAYFPHTLQVLAHLMEYAIEEGQCMCLVASPWWSYWSNYAALTKEDVLRVPERTALGLDKTQGYLDQRPADEPAETLGAEGGHVAVRPGDVVGDGVASMGVGNGNGHVQGESPAMERLGGAGKERAVPTTLARRPHEIDNSSLQVRRGSVREA